MSALMSELISSKVPFNQLRGNAPAAPSLQASPLRQSNRSAGAVPSRAPVEEVLGVCNEHKYALDRCLREQKELRRLKNKVINLERAARREQQQQQKVPPL